MAPGAQDDQVRGERALARAQQALVQSLGGAQPLEGLLSCLHRIVQAPVAVIDRRGGPVLSRPTRTEWPVSDLDPLAVGSDPSLVNYTVVPVDVDGEPAALLCVQSDSVSQGVLSTAASLVGLELSRRNAELRGRRESLAEVLVDLFAGAVTETQARAALTRHGFDPERSHQVIVGSSSCSVQRLRSFPWNLHALVTHSGDPYLRAVIDDHVVVLAPAEVSVRLADLCHEYLDRLGHPARVGVGSGQRGARGLRLSYFEARMATTAGSGVHHFIELDLPTALIGAALESGAPVMELSDRVLKPLLEHDRHNGSELVPTLTTYLATGCSSSKTCSRLFIHRNTLRYRLDLVERLTGTSPQSAEARLHFSLALRIRDLGPSFGLRSGHQEEPDR